jgi:hypothetical protein
MAPPDSRGLPGAAKRYGKESVMRKTAILAILPILTCALAGCGASHDDLIKEQTQVMKEAADVLVSVTNADTARAAEPRLRKLAGKVAKLNQQAKALPMLDETDLVRLQSDNAAASGEALEQFNREARRIAQIPECAEFVVWLGQSFRGGAR